MADNQKNLFSVAGKTAVVTGGAKGIGAMITEGLIDAGANVLVVSRSAGERSSLSDKFAGSGRHTALTHDLSTKEGVEGAARDIAGRAPEVHILVNNAGLLTMGPLTDLTREQWDQEIAVNVSAPFFLTQALLPQLKAAKRDGDPARVINIGSIAALWAKSFSAYAYAASKGGLHQLTRALASDLTREGITVNAIAPGFFPSDLTEGFFQAAPGLKEQTIAGIPAQRLGEPADIAGTVIFLCSRAGAYVSGAILPVEGGLWSA